jgi:hypothetical protein
MAVPKEGILTEIRRLAVANGGTAPGIMAFKSATGIKESAWRGRYWANWGQALIEAGYSPNAWGQPIPREVLLGRLAAYALELGHYPVDAEMRMRKHSEPGFPNTDAFRNCFGNAQSTAVALLTYARNQGDQKLAAICEARLVIAKSKPAQKRDGNVTATGSVYLMKSGPFYKVGLSNASGRREYELGIQLPEKPRLIHEIRTDCPRALETYWHDRFANKRKNGEWFELEAADLKCFKARKQFMFGDVFK